MQTAVRPPTYQWDANSGRGFWTKRKKTTVSLISVMALLLGIAIAFKLFDRTVGNNVVRDAAAFTYLIEKEEPDVDSGYVFVPGDGETPNSIFMEGRSQYPGDTRTVNVRLTNTNDPAKDASFQVHTANLVVKGCTTSAPFTPLGTDADGNCPTGATSDTPKALSNTHPGVKEFLTFWQISVEREKIFRNSQLDGDLANDPTSGGFQEGCTSEPTPDDPNTPDDESAPGQTGPQPVTEADDSNPCDMGLIRAAGSSRPRAFGQHGGPPQDEVPDPRVRTDVREYHFNLIEIDTGEDQSAFKGWTLTFDLVFNARVPAVPENHPDIG